MDQGWDQDSNNQLEKYNGQQQEQCLRGLLGIGMCQHVLEKRLRYIIAQEEFRKVQWSVERA